MTNSISVSPSFSPTEMFLHAGIVVQFVIIVLIVTCMISWALFINKTFQLRFMRKSLVNDALKLEDVNSLIHGKEKISSDSAAHILITAAMYEQEKSSDLMHNLEGIKERIALHLERLEASEGRRFASNIAILATIAAIAPFIGLFGTVWGIMTSFTGIAASKDVSLGIVAPGIAEALLATALGLVAAIPAVIIYNILLSKTYHCRALLADITAQVMRLTSRDLDRRKYNLDHEHKPLRFMPRLAGE